MAGDLSVGREAYKAGRFEDAVLAFTAALEAESTEVDDLHMIHSNRCACYMQLKQYDKAYDDAEACTALKPTWAKGWVRLGAASGRLGKATQGAAAYEKAAELDPANAATYVADGAKLAAAQARAEAPRGTGPRAGAGGTAGDAPAEETGPLATAHLGVRCLVFAYAIVYVASFTTNLQTLRGRYRTTVKFLCGSVLLHWGRAHGRPRLSSAYARKCLTDPGCQRLFGAVILLLGHGSLVALLPLLYFEAAMFAAALAAELKKGAASKKYALQLCGALEGALLDGEGRVAPLVPRNAAYGEVAAAFLMFAELATPRRNFILLVLYWQYLQMRIMLEGATSACGPLTAAFCALDARASAALGNPMVPALLRGAYGQLKKLAKHQVALPEPGKKPGLKCSIM